MILYWPFARTMSYPVSDAGGCQGSRTTTSPVPHLLCVRQAGNVMFHVPPEGLPDRPGTELCRNDP